MKETIIKDKEVMEKWDKMRVFTKGNSCLTNLMVFFDKITDLDKGDVIDHICLDFSETIKV